MDEARKSAREAYLAKMNEGRPADPYIILGQQKTGWIDAAIDAYEAALKGAGWVIVPREASEAMAKAGGSLEDHNELGYSVGDDLAREVYRAMLAASEAEKG